MSYLPDHHDPRIWLWAIITVGMTLVGVVLSPLFARGDLADLGSGVSNTLLMLGLAAFIAVIGVCIVTAERPFEAADDDADPPGAP